jgi:serine/threonine protein kinase
MRNDHVPVLIDFGAARQTLACDTPMLKPMYTPGFASPEHYSQQRDLLGPWSDIYSVGASMYACIAGEYAAVPADSRKARDELKFRPWCAGKGSTRTSCSKPSTGACA